VKEEKKLPTMTAGCLTLAIVSTVRNQFPLYFFPIKTVLKDTPNATEKAEKMFKVCLKISFTIKPTIKKIKKL
jgi:hypothetical protein